MKKIFLPIYNLFRKKFLTAKARFQYPDFPSDIFNLWVENFGVALDIRCLERLDKICKKMKPRSIFEFGSGVSTVVLAKYAKDNPCTIVIFEDNPYYLRITKQNVAKNYKTDNFLFTSALNSYKNYQNPGKFELVIIDGPGEEQERLNNRYFYDKIISPKTICFIDDTDRPVLNAMAIDIALNNSLEKIDFKDAFYSKKHRCSILFPQNANIKETI